MRYCPRCGAKNTAGDPVCRRCGLKLYGLLTGPGRMTCQVCGAASPADARFCSGCGRPAGARASRLLPLAAQPVEEMIGPTSLPPPADPGGSTPVAENLESSRARGCLVAGLVAALVLIVGAALVVRPSQRALPPERVGATVVASDAGDAGARPTGGFVGEGAPVAPRRATAL